MLIWPLISSEKCVFESCQVHSSGWNFYKILIFVWNLKFYLWWQIIFIKMTDLFCLFLGKYLPNIHNWITIFCLLVVLSRKKRILFCKKGATSAQLNHTCLSFRQFAVEVLYVCFLIVILNIIKTSTLGSKLNKIKNFYCVNIFKRNWYF